MQFADNDFSPYVLTQPAEGTLPLMCDSPHSGVTYPRDFKSRLPASVLRSGEDTYVDELWSSLPAFGATLLAANFPRSYIDPNRAETDIDPDILAEPWPTTLKPTEKSAIGHGLIWQQTRGQDIYDDKMFVADVENRIRKYYRPYHEALATQTAAMYEEFGGLWHLNLHSMPSDAYEALGIKNGKVLADFVLGDRDGTTCEPGFIQAMENFCWTRATVLLEMTPIRGSPDRSNGSAQ
nr:N-formylglutamate amidohydrolase [Paenalcaligenes niemegkensis]